MASCDTVALLSDACLSGFLNQSQRNALAIKLQLVNDASGNILSIDDLIDQACDNGFMNQSRNAALAIEIQLWCNLSGGLPACNNVIPNGAAYAGINNTYAIVGLIAGNSYSLIVGPNEAAIEIDGSGTILAGGPSTIMFTAGSNNILYGNVGAVSVTATTC